ncbi:MalY/PatB family protein [Salinimonas lutimaris]|uniref:MalY/PatB family protein n=1 Tax=Salinimonas lutimaris TaxID=914153 RepID=UPI0010C02ED0|nr:aminotransferase class I/II-fold pyridoxal phosphate-dependent enzyme [Salinimonas lutimaris]
MSLFVNRSQHNTLKYDGVKQKFGVDHPDMVSMWIADMDVSLPPVVGQALSEHANTGASGYQHCDISEAVQHWYRLSGYTLCTHHILPAAGVVQSLFACVDALTRPGNKVMVCPPVYGPFYSAVQHQQRELVTIGLMQRDGQYRIDFEALDPSASMLLLCNPNNPTGDVWDEPTLRRLSAFCRKHHIVLVCDEVHRDFIFDTVPVSAVCLFDEPDNQMVVLNSAAKSFNLAGLGPASYVLAQHQDVRQTLFEYFTARHLAPALPGAIALRAAYLHGYPWFSQVLSDIKTNRQLVRSLQGALPATLAIYLGQGTYFAWLDARQLGANVKDLLLHEYHLALGDGAQFGQPGWFRLNLATHPDVIETVMTRLCRPARV